MENLNFVDIFMIILLAAFVIDGFVRGFVVAILNVVRSIAGYVLCFFASAKLTPIIYENYIEEFMYNKVATKLGEIANLDEIVVNIENSVNDLPEFLRDVVDISKLENVTQNNATQFMMDSVVEPAANIVIKILVFVLVFILFFVLTGVIISLINNARKHDKSSLKTVDRVMGGILGLVKFGVVMFAIFAVVNMIAPYSTSNDGIIAMAKSSVIYNFIGEYNLFDVILGGIK